MHHGDDADVTLSNLDVAFQTAAVVVAVIVECFHRLNCLQWMQYLLGKTSAVRILPRYPMRTTAAGFVGASVSGGVCKFDIRL